MKKIIFVVTRKTSFILLSGVKYPESFRGMREETFYLSQFFNKTFQPSDVGSILGGKFVKTEITDSWRCSRYRKFSVTINFLRDRMSRAGETIFVNALNWPNFGWRDLWTANSWLNFSRILCIFITSDLFLMYSRLLTFLKHIEFELNFNCFALNVSLKLSLNIYRYFSIIELNSKLSFNWLK